MIILKLVEEVYQNKRKFFRKNKLKEDLFEYTRAGVIINNKPHFIISVKEGSLCDANFRRMLERYKGEVITSSKLSENEFINELLFNEKPYLKMALFQNFIKLLKNEKTKQLNVFVSDLDFDLKEELPLLLPYVKTLTIRVKDEFFIREWQRECFLEYGVKPCVVTEKEFQIFQYDVVADFDKIVNKTLCIEFLGEQKIVFPDCRFLEIPEELKFLENFELESSTICAAFGSNHKR